MSIDSTGIAFTAYTTCTAHTAHKCSIPKLHIRKGCALCRRPRKKQIAFEFKFTVKLKLEFDFDFDLISGSNFNKMGVKVVQISTYHFQI